MRRIDDFLSKGAKPDKVAQFAKLSEGKTKEEIRSLEQNMFKPEALQENIGEQRRYIVNSEHTAKFVFRSKEDMDFFDKHIQISFYMERSITDIKIILDLFRAMDAGQISYDKKTGNFAWHGSASSAEPAAVSQPARTLKTKCVKTTEKVGDISHTKEVTTSVSEPIEPAARPVVGPKLFRRKLV